jgi:exonuclease SbcC
MLVVDEGFGSQDQEGRDRIVEAIQAIAPEFERILIITHLEDLRDRFPVRIEVSKTAQGSMYAVR